MEWRKGTLQEALGHTLYDDKLGIHRLEVSSIEIYDKGTNDWLQANDLFYKQGKKYILFRDGEYDYSSSLNNFFQVKFAKQKNNGRNSTYWGYYNVRELSANDVENIIFSKIKINLRGSRVFFERNYRNERHERSSLIITKPSELKEKNYLICNGEARLLNIEPKLRNLRIGDKYYNQPNNCSCEVTKIYDYPNKDGLLFDIKLLSNEIAADITVNEADKAENQIFILPYTEKAKPSDCFNESLDEIYLQPYVTRDNNSNIYNVIWRPIDNAARYIVSLYKTVELSYKDKIYHLKDYEVDRTDNFISIEGLAGDNFVFVVKAEDRSGKEIARSRGILLGEPKFW